MLALLKRHEIQVLLSVDMPVFVGPTAEVMFEDRPYSMPPLAANITGTAFVYEDRIRIVAGRYEAEHRRGKPGDPPASLPEHRAEKLAAVHGGRARLYEKRQRLLNLGAHALTLMTALLHGAAHRGNEHVDRLYALDEEYGADALRDAISHTVAAETLTIAAVRPIKRRTMVFTTNTHPKRWGPVLHDDDLAEVIVGRVLERGTLLRLNGPSSTPIRLSRGRSTDLHHGGRGAGRWLRRRAVHPVPRAARFAALRVSAGARSTTRRWRPRSQRGAATARPAS